MYAVRPTSLLVFVPKFHMKGSVHLTDRAGLVRPPIMAPGQNTDDAFAVSQRRHFRLETGTLILITSIWVADSLQDINRLDGRKQFMC